MSSLYGQKTHSYTGNMGQPWTLMLTLIEGVQGHRWILMSSQILLVIVQGGFGLDVGFCEKLFLGLSKASWKIHYSNLKLCTESSSQTWNIKVIAWLLKVFLMSIWVSFLGGSPCIIKEILQSTVCRWLPENVLTHQYICRKTPKSNTIF